MLWLFTSKIYLQRLNLVEIFKNLCEITEKVFQGKAIEDYLLNMQYV